MTLTRERIEELLKACAAIQDLKELCCYAREVNSEPRIEINDPDIAIAAEALLDAVPDLLEAAKKWVKMNEGLGDPQFVSAELQNMKEAARVSDDRIAALEKENAELVVTKGCLFRAVDTWKERCNRLEELVREACKRMHEENGGELFRDFIRRAEEELK